jgi:hypothetical protein
MWCVATRLGLAVASYRLGDRSRRTANPLKMAAEVRRSHIWMDGRFCRLLEAHGVTGGRRAGVAAAFGMASGTTVSASGHYILGRGG